LEAGFTTVRDVGDSDNISLALRKAINEGTIVGPRIFSAGKAIATTGGHADPTNGYSKPYQGDPGPIDGVIGAEAIKRAIRAGVDSIEHGTYMDDEAIGLFKEHGTVYVPTLLAGYWVSEKAKENGYYPDVVRTKAADVGPRVLATFAKAYKAGVSIAFGTDSGHRPIGLSW
jgi:imidazolonepropionase-like amidohydrolase